MMLCICVGWILAKRGIFPPPAARGVSILSLNVGLPSLIFSSMVSSFTPQNISAFGPLALVAFMYMTVGGLLGWIVREIFYVPADFRYGIVVMGVISNWGNLPTAVVQTVAQNAPFDPSTDIELGVAYIAVFILLMNTLLFPVGLHKLCALDFKESNLIKEHLPARERWANRLNLLKSFFRHSSKSNSNSLKTPVDISTIPRPTSPLVEFEKNDVLTPTALTTQFPDYLNETDEGPSDLSRARSTPQSRTHLLNGIPPTRKASRTASLSSVRRIPPTAPLEVADLTQPCLPTISINSNGGPISILPVCSHREQTDLQYSTPITPPQSIHKPTIWHRLLMIGKSFLMPVSLAVVIAIPCSVVLPLKSLFTHVDGWTGSKMPNAPDGKPPLAFIQDTATFIGGMTIPATLILLGASIARLKTPKKWSDQPIAAICAMTAVKMIIAPVFGVFVVQALRDNTSLFPKEDLMRTFVSVLLSGTPAAVNQLVVTQLYNPAGSADTLASFLSLQYLLMPILSTALAAIALYVTEQQRS
ncbi:hypothetical protein M231_03549 [Tremella mesenterica]|uniref:Auxin efflux carrier n=1 Tax=Tremella mesenterica TaxID=5217 RepID=A0A4Q1BNB4_TREME|nr:hypothetical protein M231_03549 [Tremella mesenterica]